MISSTSLYVHIPFCVHICSYCAFNTYAGLDDLIEPTVQAIIKEIACIGQSKSELPVHTIFFGGGTPSVLSLSQLNRIIQAARHAFSLAEDAEITLEANPNDLSLEYCAGLLEIGINRLSVGIQSANAQELLLFERQHDYALAVRAFENARRAGFRNISVDLIYGSPEQTLKDWDNTLREVLVLKPEHISLYALELKGGTRLTEAAKDGRIPHPDDDLTADMYDHATAVFATAGMKQYEISNWCYPGYQSQHNRQYWLNEDYLGIGPGAHGYAGQMRYTVVRLPQRYIAKLQSQDVPRCSYPRTPATARAVRVSRDVEIQETIMMGLRLVEEGIDRQRFQERFGVDLVNLRSNVVEKYVSLGLLEVLVDRVRLTPKGRFLSNRVIADLT